MREHTVRRKLRWGDNELFSRSRQRCSSNTVLMSLRLGSQDSSRPGSSSTKNPSGDVDLRNSKWIHVDPPELCRAICLICWRSEETSSMFQRVSTPRCRVRHSVMVRHLVVLRVGQGVVIF